MSFLSRRDLLKQAIAASSLAAIESRLAGQMAPAGAQAVEDEFVLPAFVDPLPIPPTLKPVRSGKDRSEYLVRMRESAHALHSSLAPARIWGFEGQYPGPVLDVRRGERVDVTWENDLPARHLFTIDPHIHGAMPPAPEVRTVPHLHGARTTSESDGLPEKWFVRGKAAHYTYRNEQQAATLWYHDHALGITRLNVYAGLSGMYLLRDEKEQSFGLPAGAYELPLMLQDRTVDRGGQLVYAPMNDDGIPLGPGIWGPEFLGGFGVVNGAITPYVEVEPRQYRLRLLNAANTRFFGLQFNLARRAVDIPAPLTFQQIGSDGGFLPRAATMNRVLLGPAERADLLVDFSAHEGKIITVTNNAAAPYPGWVGMTMHAPRIDELLEIRVTLPRKADKRPAASFAGVEMPRYAEADAARSRDFILSERMDKSGRSLGVRINEKDYDDPVTETVKLGSLEKWRFINTTEDAHPMHLHLVQFQVLYRQGFELAAFRQGTLKPAGPLRMPPPEESGWKDTAIVLPGEMLTLMARFEGYTGKFVFHCHMLEHEDNDMMRPFVVIA